MQQPRFHQLRPAGSLGQCEARQATHAAQPAKPGKPSSPASHASQTSHGQEVSKLKFPSKKKGPDPKVPSRSS